MPDPILVSNAAAVAAKSVTSLYDFVKRKFADRKETTPALDAAATAATGSVSAARGDVHNHISGNVPGQVVQARDVAGGISFH